METIVEKLKQLQARRHRDAQRVYSEILLRFDEPRQGDAETIEKAMKELKIDDHRLEHDIHLIVRYRGYLNGDGNPATKGGEKDAEDIRKGHPDLFMFLDEKEGRKTALTGGDKGEGKSR